MVRLQRATFWRWAPHPYRWNCGFHWLGLVVLWNGFTVLRKDGNQALPAERPRSDLPDVA